ncbi:polyadenylate-binding protein 1-like [Silene latifolia]|uniref:polyadenylate-binding protein 1-like n=1 Tax=Silene latifolia TaxID=37657 RepID=UPI003D785A62
MAKYCCERLYDSVTLELGAGLIADLQGQGSMDYACTPEEVQQHFQSGDSPANKFGLPKGSAYVEFLETEGVDDQIANQRHSQNRKG